MKPSQNLETDLVFNHTGELGRTPATPTWHTSERLAVKTLEDFLRAHQVSTTDLLFDEGSGLSRNNLTSANLTVELLKVMARHRDAAVFADALPVAGVDGTLRRRMKGTPAEGNVRAKTGTLRWANALSGYVTTAVGERLVFSLYLNRKVPAAGRNNREELDAIAVLLARCAARTTPATATTTLPN
jgi:serine-type D-Ala-D-Ala carboxypeptidase/endopeptidase (penicillin-binding protein 4)